MHVKLKKLGLQNPLFLHGFGIQGPIFIFIFMFDGPYWHTFPVYPAGQEHGKPFFILKFILSKYEIKINQSREKFLLQIGHRLNIFGQKH